MSIRITREQISIETGTSDWGGPIIRITLPERLIETWSGEDDVRTFELKHTAGLEGMSGHDKGHGWHVFDITRTDRRGDWHGVLNMRRANDPEAAIVEMIDYLNHLALRDRVSVALQPLLSELDETLRHFNESLEVRSHRDHNVEWPGFLAAVAAADAAFRAATEARDV